MRPSFEGGNGQHPKTDDQKVLGVRTNFAINCLKGKKGWGKSHPWRFNGKGCKERGNVFRRSSRSIRVWNANDHRPHECSGNLTPCSMSTYLQLVTSADWSSLTSVPTEANPAHLFIAGEVGTEVWPTHPPPLVCPAMTPSLVQQSRRRQ